MGRTPNALTALREAKAGFAVLLNNSSDPAIQQIARENFDRLSGILSESMTPREFELMAETLVNKPKWTLADRDAVILALRAAEKQLLQP